MIDDSDSDYAAGSDASDASDASDVSLDSESNVEAPGLPERAAEDIATGTVVRSGCIIEKPCAVLCGGMQPTIYNTTIATDAGRCGVPDLRADVREAEEVQSAAAYDGYDVTDLNGASAAAASVPSPVDGARCASTRRPGPSPSTAAAGAPASSAATSYCTAPAATSAFT